MDETAIDKSSETVDTVDCTPKYTPIENILALRDKKLSMEQIGKLLGISKQAVSRRLKEYQPTFERIEQFKNHRADILTLKQAEIINALTPAEIQKAPPQVKSMMFGIFYDKERLERGKSTENVSIKSITEHYSKELDRAKDLLKTLEES